MSKIQENTQELQEVLEILKQKTEVKQEYILYGTYLLRDNPSFSTPSEYIDFSLEGSESYGFYIESSEITYGNIHSIQFGDDGFVYIYFDRNCFLTYEGIWRYYDGEDEVFVDVPDERFRIIDIKTPITVPKDIYDMFMGCVDNDQGQTSYDIGVDEGKEAEHNEFWDNYQVGTVPLPYQFSSKGWNDVTFYPKKDIIANASNTFGLFYGCDISNLSQRIEDCGVILDTSKATLLGSIFAYAYSLTVVPKISFARASSASCAFDECSKLVTIECLEVHENLSFDSGTFRNCLSLKNLTIEGTIGQNGLNLKWSTMLSLASITSIMTHLSTTTSGLSITLSKTAVDNAFKNGNTPGSEAPDWKDLVLSRSKWTINLV